MIRRSKVSQQEIKHLWLLHMLLVISFCFQHCHFEKQLHFFKRKKCPLPLSGKNYSLNPGRLYIKMCAIGPRRNQMAQSAQFIITTGKNNSSMPALLMVSQWHHIHILTALFSFRNYSCLSWAKAHGKKIGLGIRVPKSKGQYLYLKLVIHSKVLKKVDLRC